MKKLIISIAILITVPFVVYSQVNKEIEPYINFLGNNRTTAKDYILSLFKDHDIVILCERDHRDMTQYDLILDVIRDQYFIDHVGTVFTEVGARTLNPRLNGFLADGSLTDEEVEKSALDFQRNCMFPVWEKTNFSYFIKGIHKINKNIQPGKKVKMYPTDIIYVDGEPTIEKIREMYRMLASRDSLMADEIITRFDEARMVSGKGKALVIMNYRHAYNCSVYTGRGEKINNTGQYLFDRYAGRIANVLINTYNPPASMLHDGKWDAAFRAANIEDAGFNFNGSPFGNENFSHWAYKNDMSYKDVFSGYVFYLPIEKFEISTGLPHFMEDGFYEECIRRDSLNNVVLFNEFRKQPAPVDREKLRSLNKAGITKVNIPDMILKIEAWLKPE